MPESIAEKAKKVYQKYRLDLEKNNMGQYVAIEPESGDIFVGQSFDDAVAKAVEDHPDKK